VKKPDPDAATNGRRGGAAELRSYAKKTSIINMKVTRMFFCLLVPAFLWGQPKVLVDDIPTGAAFAGVTPIRLPFRDAAKEDPKKIEEGLNGALNSMLSSTAPQGYSYICLLSAPGEQPVEIPISSAKKNLKLSRTNTMVLALFYQGGHEATSRIGYSIGSPEAKVALVRSTVQKVAMPKGGSTAGWIYLNLTRIQAEAEKAKSPVVFVSAGGSGTPTAVPIPGLKEPLMIPEEQSTFTASWYMDPEMAVTHKGEII
jgi:hypothetical protein